MVPKGWEVLHLKDVASKIQDGNYGADYPKADEFVASGIPFLTSKVIGGIGTINPDKFDYIKEEKHQSLKKAQIVAGDILFTNRGANVGTIAIVPDYIATANIGPQLTLVRCNDCILKEYLFQFLRGSFFQKQIQQRDSGSAMNFFGIKDTERFKVLVPSLSEQKRIAQILSTWDKAISVTEKLLANSQQQKKALMQQLLTGKKRLLDENGVRFNGKWEKKLLSDVADVYQPKTISQSMMSDSGYPVYGANGVIGFYQEFNHETEQIAVTCRGSTCGIVNWTQAKSWITGNAMVINTDNYSYVSKKFLFYTLNGSDLKYLISGSGQPQITGNIKTHIINLPCIEEQQKIATVLSAADAEIYTLEKKLACLRDEKKALMQQLLTGKRRVKVDEAVAE
ncbi:restriction endonuclease subunit S [Klebsiella sp. 1SOBk12mer]|jgi:type I restriction enzyme S subunit|uniref:restriction endonuclease subunit S n=1 Tax=Enterobacteriaceae TaxID=543 RepID=UPI000651B130|nr:MULTISPECIES: restriction endonuclease subunit S [Enterobacteriaceae]MBC4033901.1 restriction endonuclease subunit S [Klebsiella pneumoniae]EFH7640323.1 restriction endonuclease subunit S [Escherichia coli]EHC5854238.1 restriction endonuclease subunit S [Escherichia coli]EIY5134416.1 restriction endonuclease subunit S [Klebsiella quasipneumoniae]KAB2323848.1 restriction endonuclease subunit S [Klebsiella quasipneumoniae]